jgi:hypothetical protein
MMTMRQLKLLEKSAARERLVIEKLNALAKDIERCEQTILELQRELAEVNSKYQGPRTTQQDIAYLSALLSCARKKLVWEKLIASLQKRTPHLLEEMTELLNNPQTAPAEETRTEMLQKLQKVQSAMERLQAVNVQ